jgi:hypothetical protein
MSYVVPSVQVYQELENASGVADVTPDLESCIVGPAYNVISYVAGSTAALVKTAAISASTATATIVVGSYTLTFDSIPPFVVGDNVFVTGAGSSGALLSATVTAALGSVLTLDTAAGTSVTSAAVTKKAVLSNPLVNTTFTLPSQIPGQVIDTASIQVFVNQAKVETVSTGFNGYGGSSAIYYSAASGTGTATAAATTVTGVTNPTNYVVGDTFTLVGAGAGGALLTAKITVIAGAVFTIDRAVGTTVTNAVMTKIALNNVNATTSTLMIESGDEVSVAYTDITATPRTFSSTVTAISSATGNVTNISLADVLPANVQAATTSTAIITAGANGFTLTSAVGFATGDTILIKGAGANGADLEAVIGTLTGAVVSGLVPATTTTVPSGSVIQKRSLFQFRTRKLFNNQLMPVTKPISGGANLDTSNTAAAGTLTINAGSEIIYGKVISANVHLAYRALRTDLSGSVLSIESDDENLGLFGVVSELNPLALGCQLAMANSGGTRTRAIAISSNDNAGYFAALDLAEGERVYSLVPLSQSPAILQAFALHSENMSKPEQAAWRVTIGNTAIPTTSSIGPFDSTLVNANSGNNTITLTAGNYILTASNATFISDGVVPGDIVNVTAGSGAPSPIGTMQVLNVISNQQVQVQASGTATAVSYYVKRTLTKTQKATAIAAMSKSFSSNRFIHIQPDTVVINVNGRDVVLPGYYLACAVAGLVAGFPSQQGFTNIGIAGVSDLKNSNFYFTRAQLNTMAEAGTFLFVQETGGGLPYVRHELTTDMSVYEYRELQAVKNWDFLSYYYREKLTPFIGKWNITPETIGVVRQTVVAASELLMSKKLPRIGAPLTGYVIDKIEQNAVNKDRLTVRLKTTQPKVLNYADVYLVI